MRLGLFGGSFDPVHRGHLELARCCQAAARLDEVWFIPAATQPLKQRGPVASDADRVAMVRLAIAGEPTWRVSEIELGRGGVSYTVDTLRTVRRRQPQAELFFLMGADSLHDFPRWREPQEILQLATPLVVARAGEPQPDFASLAGLCSPERIEAVRAAQVPMPATPISSSQIRSRAAEGASIGEMVPDAVQEFIQARRLYAQ